MKSTVLDNSTKSHLAEVASKGLARVAFDAVKDVALEVWYGSSLEAEDLAHLDGPHKRDALFLVERLAYYNVVPQPRKKVLLKGVQAAGGNLNTSTNLTLERAFGVFLPRLQPLQTRHYSLSHSH